MARIQLTILACEVSHLAEAMQVFNDRQKSLRECPVLRYKGKDIKLISKEKSASWDDKSSSNFFEVTLSYSGQNALFLFGQDFGRRMVFAMQQGTYGKEVVSG